MLDLEDKALLFTKSLSTISRKSLNRSLTTNKREEIDCPLCFQVMTDPVVLAASGIHCDLHCIEVSV